MNFYSSIHWSTMQYDLKKYEWNFRYSQICFERYHNKNSQFSQQLSIVMFNDIVTLNNMIAIIILFEEKIFENAEEETALLFYSHIHNIHTHRYKYTHAHVQLFSFFKNNYVMSDITESFDMRAHLWFPKNLFFFIFYRLKSYCCQKDLFL